MAVTANENQQIKELAAQENLPEGKTRVVSGDAKRAAFVDVETPEVLKCKDRKSTRLNSSH